jgi:hypothetical protein
MATIFAWARPAHGTTPISGGVFLTTYAEPFDSPAPPPDYWPCFGPVVSPNSDATLLAKLEHANLERAYSVCRPFPDNTSPGFYFGINGIHYQLANRILAAAAPTKDATITVNSARGAWMSLFVWGVYGRDGESDLPMPEAPVLPVLPQVDDHARRVLTASNERWEELIPYLARHPHQAYDLHPRRFEELIAELLAREGLEVELTPPQKDGGRDIMAVMNTPLGRYLYLVECKRYAKQRPVGVEIVRALYGVVEAERATAGLIITTSRFSQPAQDFHRTVKHRMQLQEFAHLCSWLERHARPK